MRNLRNVLLLWTLPVLMGFAVIASAVWGMAQKARAEEYSRMADEYAGACVNSCARCSMELSGSVGDMCASLEKLSVTSSQAGRVLALEDIVRESGEAAALLSRLPQSQAEVLDTAGFLTRIGAYARSLSGRLLRGGALEADDAEQLSAMLGACLGMSERLERRIAEGSMPMGTEDFDYYDVSADAPGHPDYPPIEYDGPYSETAESFEPLGIAGEETTADEARAAGEALLGISLEYAGKTEGRLPTYDFVSADGDISASLTVKGARLLSFSGTPSGEKEGAPDDGEYAALVEKCREYLEKFGYDDMEPVFFEYYGGAALITSVRSSGGALIYNDAVKLSIDRESMQPIGLDAREWLMHGKEREIKSPALTDERAAEAISKALTVREARLALIPLTPLTETLCYEFLCEKDGREYFVYVNAETGEEERVMIVEDDENGRRAR